jgi:hypothetical protein
MRAESLLDLAGEFDDGHRIPATRAWNLRELIAHLAEVAVSDASVWSLAEQRRPQVLTVLCKSSNQNVEVRTFEGDHSVIGSHEDRSTVTAGRHELWRSPEGPRSRDSVRRFDCTDGPGLVLHQWVGSVFQCPDVIP